MASVVTLMAARECLAANLLAVRDLVLTSLSRFSHDFIQTSLKIPCEYRKTIHMSTENGRIYASIEKWYYTGVFPEKKDFVRVPKNCPYEYRKWL